MPAQPSPTPAREAAAEPTGTTLTWTPLAQRLGYTARAAQRAAITAAAAAIQWQPVTSPLTRAQRPALDAIYAALLAAHDPHLTAVGTAPLLLPPDTPAVLAGFRDTAGTTSYVLDLGHEALYVLRQSPAATANPTPNEPIPRNP